MSTLPRFDSIDLGTASVPADAAERFAALAAQAGTGEPWTTPEQIPVGTLFTEAVYQVCYRHLPPGQMIRFLMDQPHSAE